MGWTCGFKDRAEAYRYVRSAVGERNIVASRAGSCYWMLIRADGVDPGTVKGGCYIMLALVRKEGGDYGVKFIDEGMGPAYYDCPVSLLDRASVPFNDTSQEWRERVRALQVRKAELAKGTVVTVGDAAYQLHENLGRKGWSAYRLHDLKLFRLPVPMLNRNL